MSWLPESARAVEVYLGLDWGQRRIGVATAPFPASAHQPCIASPLGVAEAQPGVFAAEAVRRLLGGRIPRAIITGLPLDRDGHEGASAQAVRESTQRITQELRDACGLAELPLHFVDERLSTAAALGSRRAALEGKPQSRGKARHVSARELRTDIEAQVAAELLQGWLDAMRG